jgi:hypothetical protein
MRLLVTVARLTPGDEVNDIITMTHENLQVTVIKKAQDNEKLLA